MFQDDWLNRINAPYLEAAKKRQAGYLPVDFVGQFEEVPERGFWDAAVAGAKAQAAGTVASQAEAFNIMGIGDGATANALNQVVQENARRREYTWQDMVNDPMKYIADPEGLTYDLAGGLASTAVFMGETAALGGVGGVAARATGLANKIGGTARLIQGVKTVAEANNMPWLSKIMESPAGKMLVLNVMKTPLESLSIAGSAGSAVGREGGSLEEQRSAALQAGALNTVVGAFTNTLESAGLGKLIAKEGGKDLFTKKVASVVSAAADGASKPNFVQKIRQYELNKGALANYGKSAVALTGNALLNAYEEGSQETIEQYTQGKKSDITDIINPFAWDDEALTSAAIGGVTGAGQGAVMTGVGKGLNTLFGVDEQSDKKAKEFKPTTATTKESKVVKDSLTTQPQPQPLTAEQQELAQAQSESYDEAFGVDEESIRDFEEKQSQKLSETVGSGVDEETAEAEYQRRNELMQLALGMDIPQFVGAKTKEQAKQSPQSPVKAKNWNRVHKGTNISIPQKELPTPTFERTPQNYVGSYTTQGIEKAINQSDNKLKELAHKIQHFDDSDRLKINVFRELRRRGITLGENFSVDADESQIIPYGSTELSTEQPQDFQKAEAPATVTQVPRERVQQAIDKYIGQPQMFKQHINDLISFVGKAVAENRISKDEAKVAVAQIKAFHDEVATAIGDTIRQYSKNTPPKSKAQNAKTSYLALPEATQKAIEESPEQAEEIFAQEAKEYIASNINTIADLSERKKEVRLQRDNAHELLRELLKPAIDVLNAGRNNGYTLVPGNQDNGRMVRMSNNDLWYQEFRKEQQHKPLVPEIEELAYQLLIDKFPYTKPDAFAIDIATEDLEKYENEMRELKQQLDYARAYYFALDEAYKNILEESKKADKESQKTTQETKKEVKKDGESQNQQTDSKTEKSADDGNTTPKQIENQQEENEVISNPTPKLTKAQKEIVDYIKKQINVDLTPFVDDFFKAKKGQINIDIKKMGKNDIQQLKSFILKTQGGYGSYQLQVEDLGNWGITIKFAKRKDGNKSPIKYSAEELDKKFQAAYHGSPHIFNEFSLEHIGTGEGAQVHGWGLYFAQDEAIAKAYRQNLTNTDESNLPFMIKIGNEIMYVTDPLGNTKGYINGNTATELELDALFAIADAAFAARTNNTYTGKISKIVEGLQNSLNLTTDDYYKKILQDKIVALTKLSKNNDEYTFIQPLTAGSVFEVDIPENDVLLDENKALINQPNKVKKALQELSNKLEADIDVLIDDLLPITNEILREVKGQFSDFGFINEYISDVLREDITSLEYNIAEKYSNKEALNKDELLEEIIQTLKEHIDGLIEQGYASQKPQFLIDRFINRVSNRIYDLIDGAIQTKAGIFQDDMTGEFIYDTLVKITGTPRKASMILNDHGIKGITYLGGRDGRCYVVFDDNAIAIKRRYETAIAENQNEIKEAADKQKAFLKDALQGGKFEIQDNGDYKVTMPNGVVIYASVKDQIIVNEAEMQNAKTAHKLSGNNISILGSWQKITSESVNGFLNISAATAKETTAYHEVTHALIDLVLTPKQKELLFNTLKPLAEQANKDIEEFVCDYVADWRLKRKNANLFGKLWNKLVDVAKQLQAWFTSTENMHNLLRKIESGEVWQQDANGSNNNTKYSAEESIPKTATARVGAAWKSSKPQTFWEQVKSDGFFKALWNKFYTDWVDKLKPLEALDVINAQYLGRELKQDEKIREKAQNVSYNSAGIAHSLLDGNANDIVAVNAMLKNKKLPHEATLQMVLDEIKPSDMNDKYGKNWLKENGFDHWFEALSNYLLGRRLREMWHRRKDEFDEQVRMREEAIAQLDEETQEKIKEWDNKVLEWERNGKEGNKPRKPKDLIIAYASADGFVDVTKLPLWSEWEYALPQNISIQTVEQMIKESPKEFAKAADIYYKLNDNLLTILEDAGIISQETHEKLNEKYKEYCPLMRDFSDTAGADEFIEGLTSGGKSLANVVVPLHKIKAEGSERLVSSPLESTINAVAVFTQRAERNKVAQLAVEMTQKSGATNLLMEMPYGTKPRANESTFSVLFDGKKKVYQCEPSMYGAIAGYNIPAASMVFKVASTAANVLRVGATSSPSFILRNLIRDTMFAGISSKNGFIPIYDTIRGWNELRKNTAYATEFHAAGVDQFSFYGNGESRYKKLTEMTKEDNYGLLDPRTWLKAFREYSELAEASTRMGEYLRAREQGKEIRLAAEDARNITLNFTRSGVRGEQFNKVVPFFNAVIQGGDKMVDMFRKDFVGTSVRTFEYIILPSIVLWCLNHDEDWYKKLNPEIKNQYWCFGKNLKVPKPQEMGVLFGSGSEAILDTAYNIDPKAIDNWSKQFVGNIAPSVIPTILLPIVEWLANYNFFRNKEVVSKKLQRLPDELQYNDSTSGISKAIGSVAKISPAKIDNLVGSATGTMGMLFYSGLGLPLDGKQNVPAKHWYELPFFRDFAVTDYNLNRNVNDFYDIYNKSEKQHTGYGKKGSPSVATKTIRNAYKAISDINKDVQKIQNSRQIKPERKRLLIDRKRQQIERIAEKIVRKYGEHYL